MAAHVRVHSIVGERFTQEMQAAEHTLFSDEPASHGGSNRGPDPYGFLLMALGAWTSMTLRMYAERKGLALKTVDIHLSH